MSDNRIIPETAQEMLDAWDAGKEVQTVEMGGLGAGYDLAIQCAAMEALREVLKDDIQAAITHIADGEPAPNWIRARIDEAIMEADARQADGTFKLGGLSGAQHAAARNLAWIIGSRGYHSVYEVRADRLVYYAKADPVELYRNGE